MKKIRNFFSIMLVLTLLVSNEKAQININSVDVNDLGSIESAIAIKNNKDLYLVDVKDEKSAELLKSECGVTELTNFASGDSKLYTAELTKSEYQGLLKKGIQIEENFNVKGCSNKKEQLGKKEWNLKFLNLYKRKNTKKNKKIKVGIIDSGIDETSDIDVKERANFVPGQDNVSSIYEDCTGHGTSIAGIIAAKDNDIGITGINSNVELYSARVFDASNSAKISQVIEAINWAIEKRVNILNLSFSTDSDSKLLHKTIKRAVDKGILVVAAAGNDGKVGFPAAYSEVLGVGAIGVDGKISDNSAIGKGVELVAPGEQILSTGMLGGLVTCGGTSMAVPHVVGVASLLWENHIDANAELIRLVLDSSAKVYSEKNKYGYGLVDYHCAEEMYLECKNSYEKNADTEDIDKIIKNEISERNTEKINKLANGDSVDYVEGRWTKEQHREFFDKASVSVNNLNVLKMGATENDTNLLQGMEDNPRWHGLYEKKNGDSVNYIIAYLYLTKVASAVGKGKGFNIDVPDYMKKAKENMSKNLTSNGVNGKTWRNALISNTVNNKNKMLFIYGMALHVITDVYSHSTYDLDLKYISHKKNKNGQMMCHCKNVCSNRYECATEAAQNLINKMMSSSVGSVSDFKLKVYNKGKEKNKCFKLAKVASFVKAVDVIFYKKNKSYFDCMSFENTYKNRKQHLK